MLGVKHGQFHFVLQPGVGWCLIRGVASRPVGRDQLSVVLCERREEGEKSRDNSLEEFASKRNKGDHGGAL